MLEDIVQEAFSRAADRDLSVERWAAKAGLHPKTILRIASGETRFPYFRTIELMCKSVGISLVASMQRRAA